LTESAENQFSEKLFSRAPVGFSREYALGALPNAPVHICGFFLDVVFAVVFLRYVFFFSFKVVKFHFLSEVQNMLIYTFTTGAV